jgi:hypothetical protein
MSELAAFFEVEKRIYQAENRPMSARLVAHYARVRHEISQDVSALLVTGFGPGQPQQPIHIMTWPSNFASPDADTTHDTNKTVYLQELLV